MVFLSRFGIAAAGAAAAASASPVEPRGTAVSVPVRLVSTTNSMKDIVNKGHSRLLAMNNKATGSKFDVSSGVATNEVVSYVADVKIGGISYELIVDTGSSNTWCGAQKSCEPSATGHSTGEGVEVGYGSGEFVGTEYIDEVSFAGLTVKSQSIGAANDSVGFTNVDGIIGFGPVDLTENTVNNTATVPTFMNNLYQQGSIPEEVLGVYFAPHHGSTKPVANGELTLGGVDSTKYVGPLTYVPRVPADNPLAPYWAVSLDAIHYNRTEYVGGSNHAVVDTGTTLIYVPDWVYQNFLSVANGTTDENTGLAIFDTQPEHYLDFTIGSATYTFTPSQYLIPQSQYEFFGLNAGQYYSYICNGGISTIDTILGQAFLQSVYSVYDTTNNRIGFAKRAPQ